MVISVLQRKLVGYAMVVFGILKISLSVLIISLPTSIIAKQSFIVPDKTIAGIVLEIVLFCFGFYSLSHGLSVLGHLHKRYDHLVHRLTTFVYLYGGLGIFLVVFYGLVVFTNVPISKDENKKPLYEMVGIGGGLGFLSVMLFVLIWNATKKYPWGKMFKLSNDVGVLVSILVVIISWLGWITYRYIANRQGTKALSPNEVVSLMMIPIGGIS